MAVVLGIVLGALGVVVGATAPFAVEWLKKPRLQIKPQRWQAEGPIYPMTFASAMVVNREIRGPLSKVLNRSPAEACEITTKFFRWVGPAERTQLFAPIRGRWDTHLQPRQPTFEVEAPSPNEPITGSISFPLTPPELKIRQTGFYFAPSMISPQQDISVGSDRGRISVAILRDGEAFAFADESYRYGPEGDMCKPDWRLDMPVTYRIEVTVKGSNAACFQVFKLEYLSVNFADFKLQAISGKEAK